MSTMTFRALDSVTALEQVQRRLGPDALILSNDLIDGQVVIVASDDEPDRFAQPAPRLRAVPEVGRIDVVIDDPIDPVMPPPTMSLAPKPRLPSFLSPDAPKPFDRVLGEAKARTTAPVPMPVPAPLTAVPHDAGAATVETAALDSDSAQTRHHAAPALPDPVILRDRLLSASRIVLLGPVGAGKSQVALQLALLRLTRNPGNKVEFCYSGTGSHSDGAFLAQKSHLLGMRTLFHTPDTLAAPDAGTLQIFVISGRGGDGPALAKAALDLPEARAALVVPTGLRPERIASLYRPWAGQTQSAILSGAEDLPETIAEAAGLRALGLVPLWSASQDRLVDGLSVIESTAQEAAAPTPAATEPAPPAAHPLLFRHHGIEAESRT